MDRKILDTLDCHSGITSAPSSASSSAPRSYFCALDLVGSAMWRRVDSTRKVGHIRLLNRSQPWDQTALTGRIFRHFGGHHEFCPIGIVVERWRSIRLFRLFKPFQEARHGDCSALNNVQAAMLAATQNGR